VTPVHVYTNADAAELFLNGHSLGVRRRSAVISAPASTVSGGPPTMDTVYGRHRLIWDDVRYEPGLLRAVALDASGAPLHSAEVATAGPPARVDLRPDRRQIAADAAGGGDLAFVTVRIVDAEGRLCPQADHRVAFEVGGAGRRVAVGNGDPTCLSPFDADERAVFHGLALLIVGARRAEAGPITIRASAQGLQAGEATVDAVA
jgi:beta-galactosidase